MSRIDPRFVDEAPRVIEQDGRDWWVVGKTHVAAAPDGEERTVYDDQVLPAVNPARAGERFESEADRQKRFKLDPTIRPGGHDPHAWIADNESDGVYGGVLFPSLSLVFYSIENSDLLSAVCRVYTDWVIEFASAYPDRLRVLAMINLDDIDAAVIEL